MRSAGEDEQGWVMGITVALFTLGSGTFSLAGGAMLSIDARMPFIAGIGSSSPPDFHCRFLAKYRCQCT
jgi:DHA1 family tetracycline resistance protein-like MFS transporter